MQTCASWEVTEGSLEIGSNTTGIGLSFFYGWGAGTAWAAGWEGGKALSTTEVYNRVLFGMHSQVYKIRGAQNGWYEPSAVLRSRN